MMTKTVEIWGRKLEIGITYESYSSEPVIDSQMIAAKKIFEEPNAFGEALEEVKKYCIKNSNNMINEKSIENIFRYVMPQELFVEQNPNKRRVALMCNYKFDEEHGIAVVFENEHFIQVGVQDIVL